jgi:hypothetical protein
MASMKGSGSSVVARVCLLALACLLPRSVLADGMVIPERAFAIAQIPDQQALLHYANGTETLVIETSFTGQGTNFAWVVPLPAVAQIEPASTGLFPTLQTIFQPKVVLSVRHYWIALPIAALVICLIELVRREPFFGLLIVGLVILLAMLLLPALAPAKHRGIAPASLAANVRVLNRQTVGLFDTVTIQSADPSALVNWLKENGFRTPTNMAPVIADYVRAGWVFAAARLHDETAAEMPRATHPLTFTFKTPKPLYPLRLTATAGASCRIDLYVFGPGRAEVPGFTVRRCEAPRYDAGDGRPRMEAGELRIRHRELRKLVAEAPVATKLSATLDARGMARDAYVGWGDYWPSGGRVYSPGAALILSGNVSALLFMALALGWVLLSRMTCGFPAAKWGPWLAPVAVAAGLAVYFLGLPKVGGSSFRTTQVSFGGAYNDSFRLAMALGDELQDSNIVQSAGLPVLPLTPAESARLLQATARSVQRRGLWQSRSHSPLTNLFTGEPIRFEASPGNVLLRAVAHPGGGDHKLLSGAAPDTYELVWHDLDGAEAVTNLVPPWRGP